MRALNRLFTRLRNFTTRRRGDERLREEMESHIATQTEENIRAGMTPEEARRHARLKFGAMETVRENYHAEAGLPFLENLLLDVRYALRVLRKSPAFTAVAILTLMLGIGANAVVFGVLNALLLQPLPVSDPQNLYQLRLKPWASGRLLTTSYPAFEDFRERNSTFSGMAAIYSYSDATLNWHNAVMDLSGFEVSGNYFDLLGVQPEVGRFFRAADEHGPDSAPYLVLSDELWRSAFHGDRGVVGATVEFNKQPFTVVGVAPPQFHGTEKFVWKDYWIPIVERGIDLYSRTSSVTVIGRLKPGVTPEQATENLNAIAAQLAKEYPLTDKGASFRLIHPGLWGDDGDVIRGFLYSVTLLALLVLAAACANLASLFAARVADRSRELALRVALGSSRWRLARQLLSGRDVSWTDTAETPNVAIVNETFARKMWGETPAIGQSFILWDKLTEVVGVVEDGKYHDLAESPQSAVFLPLSQSEDNDAVLVVRSRLAPKEIALALQHTLGGREPNVPITPERWLDALGDVLFPPRAATVALGVMGLLAAMLAVTGIFGMAAYGVSRRMKELGIRVALGVMGLLAAMLAVTGIFGMAAYGVSRRMKELGIRVALGAQRAQVMSAALGRPMALLGVGSAVGLLSGVLASRLLGHIVYQANPGDPVVVGGAVLTMAVLGVAASAIPARRALAVDPSKLMREE